MNRKSYENIRKWIKELVRIDRERGVEEKLSYEDRAGSLLASIPPSTHHRLQQAPLTGSPHQSPAVRPALAPGQSAVAAGAAGNTASALGSLPVLIIGNKLDEYRHKQKEQGVYEAVKDYGVDSIYLVRNHEYRDHNFDEEPVRCCLWCSSLLFVAFLSPS